MGPGTPVTSSIRRTGAGLDYGSIGLPPYLLTQHLGCLSCGLAGAPARALQNQRKIAVGLASSRLKGVLRHEKTSL